MTASVDGCTPCANNCQNYQNTSHWLHQTGTGANNEPDCAKTRHHHDNNPLHTERGTQTMKIIRKTEGLTSADMYALTKGNDVQKMSDAKGEVLDIAKFVLYEDEDQKGELMNVLAVETVAGVRYATNSKTFVRNFSDIMAIYEAGNEVPPTQFKVGSGKSKGGREYITCDIA